MQLLTYGVIGLIRGPWNITKIWPMVARFSLEEAQAYRDALEQEADKFKVWEKHMRAHNPKERWEDLTDDYIEAHMLDKTFEPGATYDILCFPEDSAQ